MTTFPKGYEWLGTLGVLPKMLSVGLDLVGIHEGPGSVNNPTILSWAKETGLDKEGYSADSIPWCGLFMSLCAVRAGKTPPKHPMWALNWGNFGTPVHQPCLGDVLTFLRTGGGHVTMYVGEDQTAYHCLGGNQSDQVCIERIAKVRMHSTVQPPMTTPPASRKPYILTATGPLSTNEA